MQKLYIEEFPRLYPLRTIEVAIAFEMAKTFKISLPTRKELQEKGFDFLWWKKQGNLMFSTMKSALVEEEEDTYMKCPPNHEVRSKDHL